MPRFGFCWALIDAGNLWSPRDLTVRRVLDRDAYVASCLWSSIAAILARAAIEEVIAEGGRVHVVSLAVEEPHLGAGPGELSLDVGSDPGILVSRRTQI